MGEDVLHALQERLQFGAAIEEGDKDHNGTGIGLVNIDKRLKIKYGPLYGIQVDSTPGKGTIVTIMFPITLLSKDDDHV